MKKILDIRLLSFWDLIDSGAVDIVLERIKERQRIDGMKVFITGASGVGKSTFAKYISETHGLSLLGSVTESSIIKLGYEGREPQQIISSMIEPDDWQRLLFDTLLEMMKTKTSFVAERTVFDILAYTALQASNAWTIARSEDYLETVHQMKDSKAFVFYIEPHKSIISQARKENRRSYWLNTETVYRLDGMIKLALEMADINYFSVNTPKLEERKRFADAVLTRMKKL